MPLPGARSSLIGVIGEGGEGGQNLFLGGNYIELGLTDAGSFGTYTAKPEGFFGTNSGDSGVGLSSDADGYDNGLDLRIDYFLPGSPEERWAVGWTKDSLQSASSFSTLEGNIGEFGLADVAIRDDSRIADGILIGYYAATVGNLRIEQVHSFSVDEQQFQTVVTVTNIGSETLDDVRFMRSHDPDNTVYYGGDYTTDNTLEQASPETTSIVARSLPDQYSTDSGKLATIAYFTTDPRAQAATYNFTNTNPYEMPLQDQGYYEQNDIAISLQFKFGSLAPGQSASANYFTILSAFAPPNYDVEASLPEAPTIIKDDTPYKPEDPKKPVYLFIETGAVATPSFAPDLIEFSDEVIPEKPEPIVTATIEELDKDKFKGFGEGKKIGITDVSDPKKIKKRKGSAVFWVDDNDNGIQDFAEKGFILEGDYDLDNFSLDPDGGNGLILTYKDSARAAAGQSAPAAVTPPVVKPDLTPDSNATSSSTTLINPDTGATIEVKAVGDLSAKAIFKANVLIVEAGEVGYGSSSKDKLRSAPTTNGTPEQPAVLAAGAGGDRYKVGTGLLTVISETGGERKDIDKVTGLAGKSSRWQWRRVGDFDYLLQNSKDPDTSVLFVDPLGLAESSNKIEKIGFKGGQDIRSEDFLGDKDLKSGSAISYQEAISEGIIPASIGSLVDSNGELTALLGSNLELLASNQ